MRKPAVYRYSAIVFAALLCLSLSAFGQSDSQGQVSAPNILVQNQAGQQGQQGSPGGLTATTTPSAQNRSDAAMRNFLQNRPEVMDQLKLLLVQRMRDDGSLIDEQAVTDQMVYERLQTDPDFRRDALQTLVDQGYISEDDARMLLASENNPNYAQGQGYESREGGANASLYPNNPENANQGNLSGTEVEGATTGT